MNSRTSVAKRRRRALAGVLLAAGVFFAMATAATAAPPGFSPIDPQNWEMPDDMTWEDYTPVPGTNWADPSLEPSVQKWRMALVLMDFADQPFNMTLPAGSTVFGNPQP